MKLVVYTVLVGDKEPLNDPLRVLGDRRETDLDLSFVCFTDNTALRSDVWEFRPIPERPIPPDRLSRLPKALPHLMFPDHTWSLYIDNTVVFRRLPNSGDLGQEAEAVFRAFRHPWRTCPQDEADVVVRSGLDEAGRVGGQCRFYDGRTPLADIQQLTAGTTLLRRHDDARVRAFGEMWWEQILLFSARDQLSLDLCAQLTNCPIHHFPGDKCNSDLIIWPALNGPRRIEGGFDADRYAWDHRQDPEARQNPRAHFLAHGSDNKYKRSVELLSYYSLRAGSGLGAALPPRRALAPVLEPLLAEIGGPVRVLVAGVASPHGYSADAEEIMAAGRALGLYFRFGPGVGMVTAMIGMQDVVDPNPFQAAGGQSGFQLAIVIGLLPEYATNVLSKFRPLLAEGGVLVAQFGGSVDLGLIPAMRPADGAVFDMEIYHGGHISRTTPIPNSVFVFRRR